MTFRVVAARPRHDEPRDAPVPLQLWLGDWNEEFVGILNDPPIFIGGYEPNPTVAPRISHTSSLTKVFIDDRIAAISGLDPRQAAETALAELSGVPYLGVTHVSVDGEVVLADVLAHRGLRFALGREIARHPFVVVQLVGGRADWWPALTASPAG